MGVQESFFEWVSMRFVPYVVMTWRLLYIYSLDAREWLRFGMPAHFPCMKASVFGWQGTLQQVLARVLEMDAKDFLELFGLGHFAS